MTRTRLLPRFFVSSLAIAVAIASPGWAEHLCEPPCEEISVTATRRPRPSYQTPAATISVEESEILQRVQPSLLPEALGDAPGVMLQKTAAGQVSPYLRGFTGFHNLFLIDGVRLNNSVQRPGPNQYWGTVDALAVERLEMSLGPGGALYGADAVGGVVRSFSRSPWGGGDGPKAHGRALYRYGSADDSSLGRAEASVTYGEDLGLLLGVSPKRYGDVVAGPAVGRQPESGYTEIDGDFKLVYRPREPDELVIFYQHVSQMDVPRTHKTLYAVSFEGTTVGSERRRGLDQNRDLAYVRYRSNPAEGFYDVLNSGLSWQRTQEQRDRIRGDGRRELSGFRVHTLGAFTQLESDTAFGSLVYGFDYYHDFVESWRDNYNADGSFGSRAIQGPVAGDADYDLLGLYAEWSRLLFDGRLELFLGGRFTYADARAREVEDPVTGLPFSISDHWTNFSASLRAVWSVAEPLNLYTAINQGFRAPNLSDLTRFDTARTNEIQTPSPNLSSETFLGLEIGAKSRGRRHRAGVAVFGTLIYDGLIRTPTGDVIDGNQEVQVHNIGDGFVTGFEVTGSYLLWRQLELFANGSYVYGKQDTFPTSAPTQVREYIDRMQPFSGNAGLRWGRVPERFWAEIAVQFALEQDRLSTRDQSDTQRIPPGGTPGWVTVNLRGGYEFNEHLNFALAIENLANRTYRVHGSGITAPGTNVKLTTQVRF